VSDDDPIARFAEWFADALRSAGGEPAAMTLATVDERGRPAARVVLLRGLDERGLVFYTNLGSRKARELRARPHAAACFYWDPLGRQARVEGRVEAVAPDEADEYWRTRPRESQLGAWASEQSEPLAERALLVERMAEAERRFAGREVPRPPYWGGLRLVPDRFEFWVRGEHRLHDRDEYTLRDGAWARRKLYP
jgi:pyridoxamine 5'-phosphate oxidase